MFDNFSNQSSSKIKDPAVVGIVISAENKSKGQKFDKSVPNS